MLNTSSYDVLQNQLYEDRFLYIPCFVPMRSDFAISPYKNVEMRTHAVDLVRCSLDFAFMPESEALQLEFSPQYFSDQVQK